MIDTRWQRQEAKKPLGPHGWIQWKGTNVCMDVTCSCGALGHIDRWFAYHYKCLACKKLFDIAGYVHLIEVPDDEITENDLEGRTVATDPETIQIPNPDAPEETEPMYEDDAPPCPQCGEEDPTPGGMCGVGGRHEST